MVAELALPERRDAMTLPQSPIVQDWLLVDIGGAEPLDSILDQGSLKPGCMVG